MAQVFTVRNMDETAQKKLRHRAVDNGRSFEAEVRAILEDAADAEPEVESSGQIILEAARKFREEAKKVGGFTLPERIIDYPRELFS